jgi:putative ATP-dependent endonuclease of OLD family
MHLEGLEIVNFRGIARLRLRVEPDATVLFGENAWGKSSLVEALQSTLGARPLAEADFHRLANDRTTIARRMGITLGFRGEPPPELEGVAWRDAAGEGRIELQWSGRRPDRGKARFRHRFLDAHGREIPLLEGEAARLADRIRRDHPLLVFRDLRLADATLAPALAAGLDLHEDPEKAVGRVFERLLSVPHQVHPGELARGLEALKRVAARRPDLFQALHPAGESGLRRATDIADTPLGVQGGNALADLAQHAGAGMRQVVLLTLVGAMLQAGAGAARGGTAQPILVLEDPETHLHPIQLATAMNLVSQLSVQKLVTSASGALMAGFPLRALRRLVRRDIDTVAYPDPDQPALGPTELRRVSFHVRTHNADSLFARVWLLVEGETEAWLLPELARTWGLNFPLEGIHCVPFAQAGLAPLVAFADRFGIPWHLIADGDEAGRGYVAKARRFLHKRPEARHITALPDPDLEHFLWREGYEEVFRREAGRVPPGALPTAVIHQALRACSKPGMALELAEEAGRRGPAHVPALLGRLFGILRDKATPAGDGPAPVPASTGAGRTAPGQEAAAPKG